MADKDLHFTRRSLLDMGLRSLAVAGIAPTASVAAEENPALKDLSEATADSFAPLVGKTILFLKPVEHRQTTSTVALKLTEVSRHEHIAAAEARMASAPGKRSRSSFSLVFELEGREPLGSGLHAFAEGEFKGSLLFLSALGPGGKNKTLRYEAVFG